MANTKVTGDLIASGTITAANLVSGTLDALLNSYLTTNTYATQGYVTTAVNNLIDAAPASLDTLNELAAALNDDANFATTVTNALATKLNLSGGTLTGNLTMNGSNLIAFGNGTQYINSPDGSDLTLGAADDINFNSSYMRYFNSNNVEYARLHGASGDSWINGGGNLGIGTNTPNQKLDVQGNQLLSGNLYLINTNTRISSDGNGEVGINYATGNTSTYSLSVYNSTTRAIGLGRTGDAYFAGQIGIGTTSPSQKVTIEVDSSSYNALELRDSRSKASTPESALSFRGRYSGAALNTMGLVVGAYNNSTDADSSANLQFYVNNGSSVVQAMKLQSDSSLAIANGAQSTDAISSQIIFGNRGYFSNPAVGGAKIVGITGSPYWYSSTSLAFYTNGGTDVTSTGPTEKMRITGGGNVGIGTTSPQTHLDVVSNVHTKLRVRTTGVADASVELLGYDAGVHIGDPTNGNRWAIWNDGVSASSTLSFGSYALGTWYDANSQVLSLTSNGRVGIGTTNPSAKLHVSDSTIIDGDLYVGGSTSLRHPALDRFATVQSTANGAIVGYNMVIPDGSNNRRGSLFMDDGAGLWGLDHTYSSGSMDFVVRVAGGELMRVNSEGKVGIGNSAPSDKLSIKNLTGDAGILLEGPSQTLRIDQNSIRTLTNSPIHIFTNNAAGTNCIYLSNNGNVGIGTSSPGYKLEVNGSIALEGANALGRQGSSLNPAYNVLLSGGLGFVDLRTPAPGNFKQGTLAFGFTSWNLNNSGGWADMLGLHSYTDYTGGDGNLLIVNRNGSGVKVARQTWNSSTAYSSGTIYTLDYTSASDQAVKENVQDITGCLDAITSLRPVTYEWTDEYILNGMSKNSNENVVNEETGEIILPQNKTTNVGLIAQEVEQVIPTVVHQENIRLKGSEEALKNISYDKLVPHLIGAIKELKAEVEALKQQLNM